MDLNMIEDDCEDQGYSLISDGCTQCMTDEVIIKHGVEWRKPTALVAKNGLWVCPSCGGCYGTVNEVRK